MTEYLFDNDNAVEHEHGEAEHEHEEMPESSDADEGLDRPIVTCAGTDAGTGYFA